MNTFFRNFSFAMGMTLVLMGLGYSGHARAFDACGMLSREQVDSLLPGNNGPMERDTSEASLLEDVEMGHCTYPAVVGTDFQFLDLIVYKAGSDEAFEQVDISKRAQRDSVRKLDIGDVSFLEVTDSSTISVSVSKGLTEFDLSLNATDAEAKSEQLIELARFVAGKL
jgi:hypothetical protein